MGRRLRQVAHRVDHFTVHPHLEVQVRAEAQAGAVADADPLALAHLLADRDGDRLLVGVAGRDPAAVVDARVVPVARLGARDRDLSGGSRVDRRAAWDADVNPRVAALPRPLLAEGGGNGPVDGPDHYRGALPLDRARACGGGPRRRRGGLGGRRGRCRLRLLLGLKLRLNLRGDVADVALELVLRLLDLTEDLLVLLARVDEVALPGLQLG